LLIPFPSLIEYISALGTLSNRGKIRFSIYIRKDGGKDTRRRCWCC